MYYYSDFRNSADDNSISAFPKGLQELFNKLENASECAIKCFANNWMIVNPGKFQFIIIERSKGKINQQSLKINSNLLKPTIVLLRVKNF